MNMAEAQLQQAKVAVVKLASEKECYIRLTILLARAVIDKAQIAVVDGNVCFKKSQFDAVPKAYGVTVKSAKLKDADASDPNAPDEDFLVVVVSEAKEKPLLVAANGRV